MPSRGEGDNWLTPPTGVALPLKARVLQLIDEQRLRCEYHPIVDLATEAPVAHEALARFDLDGEEVAPNLVFAALNHDHTLLFMLESKIKEVQIQHRPPHGHLFVNLDPHACVEPYQVQHWTDRFQGHDDIIVELIENTTVANLGNVQSFLHTLRRKGIRCALDDVGGPRTMFCFDLLDDCHYIKLDRRWFWRIEADRAYLVLLKGLVDFANAKGIGCIIEGVETRKHLEVARHLGIRLAQGALFADLVRRLPAPARPEAEPRRSPRRRASSPPPRAPSGGTIISS
jgi:EAL domain-containing protein (putative c-di-GMP-specific phosphodiesterase class I)